ncbi:leukosialin [Dromiciops gliroides]|uniref:leukosialin n=1 Tax=Dromiciops gliroides TaxID=33562 RepID=UPI001CC4AABA|nr:leukosialin [Dromiciops gliroides]
MVSPLSLLLLLILTECCWASTASVAMDDTQTLDMTSVSVSSDLYPPSSHLALQATSLPASTSDMAPEPSPILDAGPLTSLMTEVRESTSTTEAASPTTLASTEGPSSTKELATHPSSAVTMVTTPFSSLPTFDPTVKQEKADISGQEENTTLVTKETTSSEVISANTTTFTMTRSSQVFPTTFTSSTSLTNVSPANQLKQDRNNSVLVILVVVVLTMTLLAVLFFLWRRRQKRRTGALILSGSGKHKGAGDAWAGPAQVTEEQAASGSAAVEGEIGTPEGEGTGRRPTLTTFFGRRKSRQGSVMLEDLEAGTVNNNLKDESEPLVENVDGAVKPSEADDSSADGSVAGDGNLPSAPVTKV